MKKIILVIFALLIYLGCHGQEQSKDDKVVIKDIPTSGKLIEINNFDQFFSDVTLVDESADDTPTFTWESSDISDVTFVNPQNATDDESGEENPLFWAVGISYPQSITITLTVDFSWDDADGNSHPGQVTTSCIVYVTPIPVTSVTVSPSELTMLVGETKETLSATVGPNTATYQDITWSSDNDDIATIDSTNGIYTVIGIYPGQTTITATSVYYDNIFGSCAITIEPVPVTSVKLSSHSFDIFVGHDTTITKNVYPDSATYKKVTWDSSNEKVVTIDTTSDPPNIHIVGSGNSTIKVTSFDGVHFDTCHITAKTPYLISLKIDEPEDTLSLNEEDPQIIDISTVPIDADSIVTWLSSNDSIVAVNMTSGMVTAISGGEAVITATSSYSASITATEYVQVPPVITNIIIYNTEDPSITDFIAGRGSKITITGSGFGNSRSRYGQTGYVSFTNADNGGGYIIINNQKTNTKLVQDLESCDYISWSDNKIVMFLPSVIFINQFGKPNYLSIGSGTVTVTNNAQLQSTGGTESNIIIPHSFIDCGFLINNTNFIKVPSYLTNGIFKFSYAAGFNNINSNAIPLIQRAAKEWSCRTNVNLSFVNSYETTTNTISYLPIDVSKLMETISGDSLSSDKSYCRVINTSITINTIPLTPFDYALPDNKITYADFYESILHEIGHALQLNHINNHKSLMYYKDTANIPWNERIDLRNPSDLENSSVLTDAVNDVIYMVRVSQAKGFLSAYTPSSCAPAMPVNFVASVINSGTINLNWASGTDMDYYWISRTNVVSGADSIVCAVYYPIAAGSTNATDNTASSLTGYTYNLQAINSFGNTTAVSKEVSTTKILTPIVQPLTINNNNQITVNWTGNAGSYTILRSSNGNTPVIIVSNWTSTSYTDKTAVGDTTYTYQVVGVSGTTTAPATPVSIDNCLSSITGATYTSSVTLYPCQSTITFTSDTIQNNSNVTVSGSANSVIIQGPFQVQVGSSFYAK